MKIPQCFHDQILSMPEYQYGINRIKITLSTGKKYKNVYVAWGEDIIKVGNDRRIPFDSTQIIAVENQ